MSEHSNLCLNCGATLSGEYCSQCGQHSHEHAPTLGHALHELIHEVFHVDGKIFRSVRALFFSPGLLTSEYWAGRIVSWVRPLRLFLIAAALHLLFASHAVGPMNFRALVTVNAEGERGFLIGQDPEKSLKPGFHLAPEPEQQAFAAKLRKHHTSVRYLSVILFALVSWAAFRKRQPFLAMHLVLGLHFFAFWYAISIFGDRGPTFTKWMLLLGPVYLLPMLRKVYGMGWVRAFGGAVFLWFCLVVIETALVSFALWMTKGV